ncbi:MAG TPA: sulfatase-like hydrolase/transferase [Sedimentisphaerales bacterium]|nr:sulfatase-like hydrolase/transferase [Sedimentisphaerales bacterium]
MQATLDRRDFLLRISAAATALAVSRRIDAVEKPVTKPNILLIVSDDQGWGDASCNWKDTDVETPVMDQIAATGVRFSQFYVNPLCGPTRSSFLTGQYSMENGMWRGPSSASESERCIKSDVTLLPQFLKKAGYRTGIFGKWHLGYQSPNTPNDRGFDEFYGFLGGAHPYVTAMHRLVHNGQPYTEDLHLTDYFTEKAMSFIRDCAHKRLPFFCYVPYNAVHGPLWRADIPKPSGKPEWLQRYVEKGVDFPRRDYNAVLEHMDHSVGRLLALLAELGLEENTLVIYFSDNGACLMTDQTKADYPGNNGPFRDGKGSTYEGGIRVPCVMRWKGKFPEGVVSDELVVHFDIFSTIMEAAGVAVPKTNGQNPVHGLSLMKHILSAGKIPLPERTIFWELTGKVAARRGKWKIVGSIENPRGRWERIADELSDTDLELYDLESDISESQNLRENFQEQYASLKEELISFFRNIR